MKTETHIVEDHAHLKEKMEIYGLKIASSLQRLCRSICEAAKIDQTDCVLVKITLALIPQSYHSVPAMFARLMEGQTEYKFCQSWKQENYLVFRAAMKPRLSTFRARAIQACSEGGSFKSLRTKIPKSYRRRPSVMARIIEDETCLKIATIAKKNTITWKVKAAVDKINPALYNEFR